PQHSIHATVVRSFLRSDPVSFPPFLLPKALLMLIENVIDHYIEVGKKHQGNPFRLSNSGRCVRALAYQRFQSTFKSEPMPARVLMVVEEGKRDDKWMKEEFRKHCANS